METKIIKSAENNIAKEMLQVTSATFLIAFLSQIVIPFKPVPLTGQTLGILLAAGTLGRKKGMLSVLTYVLLGTIGMPFFAGGDFGPARLAGPTGGYLAGFIAAAYLVGFLSDRGYLSSFTKASLAMIAGNAVIYLFGVIWLSQFTGWNNVLSAGIFPFIPGDIIKIIVAASVIPSARKFLS
ncbi:MAG TPA: biotin transporter BioY [Clostridiales bacterium]|jgi:biotin transport system substrate-specific component|nr:biotin transporter BioY [Clostridiales bacterium]HQP70959.1 biotin transporter BioY [Clostridiales bacterium]